MTFSKVWVIAMALGLASPALAANQVTCKDGTTANAGRGACSGHGGVKKASVTQRAKGSLSRAGRWTKGAVGGTVTCHDGTTGRGRNACRGHGGIASARAKATASRHDTAARRVQARTGNAAARTTDKAEPGARGSEATDAAGATARCKDGTWSHAANHQGACSDHGGVAEWLDRSR
jgi:hypothetical protein